MNSIEVKVFFKELKIQNIKKMLSRYSNYIQIEREIKINSLLEKNSQLEITEINPPMYGCNDRFEIDIMLTEVSFLVNKIFITFDKYLNIKDIILNIKILETQKGNILYDIISKEPDKITFVPVILSEDILHFTNVFRD
jgi:hypothetical protein